MPDDAQQTIDMAFGMIRTAATLLSAFPYGEAAASLRRQEDSAWLTDPTMMLYHDRDDLNRKLRLLDAAANFLLEWEAVKAGALAADGSVCEASDGGSDSG